MSFTYPEAIFAGLVQGSANCSRVQSGARCPTARADRWEVGQDMNMSTPNSPYLDILVRGARRHRDRAGRVLLARLGAIIGGLFTSIRDRRIETNDQRLAGCW